jgi:hypothetical protein
MKIATTCLLLLVGMAADAVGELQPSAATRFPDEPCRLDAVAAPLHPGEVSLVILRCDVVPERLAVTLSGVRLLLFPLEEERSSATGVEAAFGALVGIDLAASPGTREIVWEAHLPGGRTARGNVLLGIERRTFPTQKIRVPPRFDALDAATLARAQEERRRMRAVLAGRSPERSWRGAFDMPASGATSGFGARRVVNGRPSSPHSGLDIAAPRGTPVLASNAGAVVLADTLVFAGGTVVLDHGLGLFTIYSHLSEIAVTPGQRVARGQVIARSGASGRVTGPHLHWAVNVAGARVDPMSLVETTGKSPFEAPDSEESDPIGVD